MMSCTTVGHITIITIILFCFNFFLGKVWYCHNFYATITTAEKSSKIYYISVTATGFDRKRNEYIYIQAAHAHAPLMTCPFHAGTKPLSTFKFYRWFKVCSVLWVIYNSRPTTLSYEP